MKIIITIISIIIIIIVRTVIITSTANNTSETEVVVVRDITDIQLSQPKSDDIARLFDLSNSQWNGAKFRFIDISDVSYNQTFEANIITENQWMGNEFDREKKVKTYYAEMSRILNDVEKETIGKNNSSVYFPIASELNKLSKSKLSKKILLIYSDLMENTTEMSFYDKEKFNLLTTHPDLIKKYFDSQLPLASLQGININIIFQPNGTAEDEQFQVVSGFYKNLFESKGGKVEISANID